MPRQRILALSIFFITAGVMIILTAVRYSQRQQADREEPTTEVSLPHSTGLHEARWDQLPTVPEFSLTERSGRPMDTAQFDGRVWLVSFFFTSCPSVCRDQNQQIAQLQEGYQDKDLTLLSITCDPENDTPVKLRKYAETFEADPEQWLFLTGEYQRLKQISEEYFQTALSTTTHGTNLMLIDKWGRLRDRFDWQDPTELLRMRTVLDQVLAESEPPRDELIETRVPTAGETLDGGHAVSWKDQPWINEFTLTERDGDLFSTEAMRGEVWLASFFFTRCPSICKQQNHHLAQLQRQFGDRQITLVSITTDPDHDKLPELRTYAKQYAADPEKWLFVRGDELYTRRIAAEYFETGFMKKENHTTELMLVDKWGTIRGRYHWDDPEQLLQLRKDADRLLAENKPPEEASNGNDAS